MRWIALPLCLAIGMVACEAEEQGPSPEELAAAAQADSVRMAQEAYDTATFDTLTWESQQARVDRGSVVYRYSCVDCHGATGEAEATVVFRGDTLNPTSLIQEEWALAEDVDGLRRVIFTGTAEGMPHFGMMGLGAKDIDAVIGYIQLAMRR